MDKTPEKTKEPEPKEPKPVVTVKRGEFVLIFD